MKGLGRLASAGYRVATANRTLVKKPFSNRRSSWLTLG